MGYRFFRFFWMLFCCLFCTVLYAGKQNNCVVNSMDMNVVVITGATKGLGEAMVDEFVKRGWKVAGCGRAVDDIQRLQQKYGVEHLFSVVDITDDSAVANWASTVHAQMGSPKILVNNAGVINRLNVLWKIPSSEFSEVMNINVLGSVNTLRYFIPLMINRKEGTIVTISSDGGIKGEGELAPYCASKFALEAITQSLAHELPEGFITVAIDPGATQTNMLSKTYPKEAESYPTAIQRAEILVPFLLNLTTKANGKHLTLPS